jgi:virulence factor Mce-like protein
MRARVPKNVGQTVLLRTYGVVFLVVIALLVGLTIAIYQKTFVDVVHVTLQANRVGNQLAPPADVKLRGMIVGEVREVSSDGERAEIDLALKPELVGLIPADVQARLLPKTLFGEKFVDLVIPPQAGEQRIAEGDVIPQDRSAVAIELEQVLEGLLPLLRTVQPAELNATLSAFANALEGRGDQLGENLELVDRYFAEINPRLDTIKADLRGLADVTELYAEAGPDLVRALRNFSVGARTVAEKADVYAGFLAGTAGFATTTRQVLQQNENRIIQLNRVSRPTLNVLAKYSPEYPCLLQGLAESDEFIGRAFANGELHITLEVVESQDPYRRGDGPAWGERSGPNCRGLPRPPIPAPPVRLDDGTRGSESGQRAVPGFLVDPQSGSAGSPAERGVVAGLVAPVMGRSASDVPDLATLLFGPMARGTAVGQS